MMLMLVPMFLLLLLLLLEMMIPVTARLNSVHVISFTESRKTQNGQEMCALDQFNETTSSSSLQDCSITCARDATCAGFNMKNSLTCDHINTPVLASTSRTHSPVITSIRKPVLTSTSRTHSPVITSIHLYWLQHQELTHLWSHQYTCTDFNIKNSLTCDHINTPVLASTSRTHSPVITSIHMYWLQHQELTHMWSHQYTCTDFNLKNSLTCDHIKNSLTCDHINTPVLTSTSRTHSPVMCTIIDRRLPHLSQPAFSTRLLSFHILLT